MSADMKGLHEPSTRASTRSAFAAFGCLVRCQWAVDEIGCPCTRNGASRRRQAEEDGRGDEQRSRAKFRVSARSHDAPRIGISTRPAFEIVVDLIERRPSAAPVEESQLAKDCGYACRTSFSKVGRANDPER